MELARGMIIPVLSDYVLTPEVYYADQFTGICFQTPDDGIRAWFDRLKQGAKQAETGENIVRKVDLLRI